MKNRDEYLRIEAEVARDTALRELSELKRQHERLQMAAAPFAKLHGERRCVGTPRRPGLGARSAPSHSNVVVYVPGTENHLEKFINVFSKFGRVRA